MAIAGECAAADQAQLTPLIEAITERHDPAVIGILYYGSCFRRADPSSGLVDFYVVVDTFRSAGLGPATAIAGTLVPPNVYYLEADGALACKYALITYSQLQHGVTRWFCSTLWGRFAQPVGIVYALDERHHEALRAACGQAAVTLLERALPALGSGDAQPEDWFEGALRLSFGSEIRVESNTRTNAFIGDHGDEYARRFRLAEKLLTYPAPAGTDGQIRVVTGQFERQIARARWWLRGLHGRILSILRLVKACFTFDGAIDYGAWKLARHTGCHLQVTPKVRQHPLIHGWPLFWRAFRAARRQRRQNDDGQNQD